MKMPSFFKRKTTTHVAQSIPAVVRPQEPMRPKSRRLQKRTRNPNITISDLLRCWIQPSRTYDSEEAFFPFPKLTFLIDKPKNIVCQICRESTMELRSSEDEKKDTSFSILPCGHVACSRCLIKWVKAHKNCPFCKLSLEYPRCKHPIQPRHITKEGLYIVPKTLPDGGSLLDSCSRCTKAKYLRLAEEQFEVAAEDFGFTRNILLEPLQLVDEETLMRKKDAMESIVRDLGHMRYVTLVLDRW